MNRSGAISAFDVPLGLTGAIHFGFLRCWCDSDWVFVWTMCAVHCQISSKRNNRQKAHDNWKVQVGCVSAISGGDTRLCDAQTMGWREGFRTLHTIAFCWKRIAQCGKQQKRKSAKGGKSGHLVRRQIEMCGIAICVLYMHREAGSRINGTTLPAIPPPHHHLINFQDQVAEHSEQDE